MQFQVLTIFPGLIEAYLSEGFLARARRRRVFELEAFDIRKFADLPHRKVDDRPYGGGPGMVMACEPIDRALEAAEAAAQPLLIEGESHGSAALRAAEAAAQPLLIEGESHGSAALRAAESSASGRRIFLTPQGPKLTGELVRRLAAEERIVLLAGRYEGVDQRVLERWSFEEVSIGDYVLAGGELPALVLIEAVVRWLPGALGHPDSVRRDALSHGQVGHAQYTRPDVWRGRSVPEVLIRGDHRAVRAHRRDERRARTGERNSDRSDEA